jgi:hypothetical protein
VKSSLAPVVGRPTKEMHDAECFLEYPAPQLPRGGKGPGGKNNTGIVSNKVFLQFSRDGAGVESNSVCWYCLFAVFLLKTTRC